ncbi:ABC transporter C family member 8 [Triticum urartu]|uniref:ABC transporter C family member 13 n=2 Tax=Triticum urartu TaxID=4572 RepID=M7YJB6_TRIUA|nr:ABC transporter C family member 8 [Triticum urartu]
MSFWWMNPLMKKGYRKPLEEKDIPALDVADQAGTQYSMFVDKINAKQSSLFWVIVSCYKRDILFSGFFALLKVLTLSSGPLLVKEFINVSSGKEAFKHEGVVIALGLLLSKCLESLAQRQWYFQTRRVGIQVQSLLSASIYRKQQKLSCFASIKHSSGEIMNYLIVDAYRVGEFPFWFHRTWTTGFQLGIALAVLYDAVGPATIASVLVIMLTVLLNAPLARQQQDFQKKLMEAQDMRLKAMSESLVNMKVLKLYAWEAHFKSVIEHLRELELKWLSAFQLGKAYTSVVFWASPALVSAATFIACYFLGVPLNPSNVFTFVAALRLVQDPINHIPNVIGSVIQARVAFSRISSFLGESELPKDQISMEHCVCSQYPIVFKSGCFSWDSSGSPNLRNINLEVKAGTKVAICGEVGSGKSTLLAAILGEVPRTEGMSMSVPCSMLPQESSSGIGTTFTIGIDRWLNGFSVVVLGILSLVSAINKQLHHPPIPLSGRRQEYVMGALSEKTVLLVTHQVEFLHAFDSVVDLVKAHEVTTDFPNVKRMAYNVGKQFERNACVIHGTAKESIKSSASDQLIKTEGREIGDTGLKPYLMYLGQNKGYIYASLVAITNIIFACGQIFQNSWLAVNVQNPCVCTLNLVLVYTAIGFGSIIFLLSRALLVVDLGLRTSGPLFAQLLSGLFCAPMSFYHSTPLGRILSRVSSDLSIIDLDLPFTMSFSICATLNAYINSSVLCFFTWQILLVAAPVIIMAVKLQRYYLASSKELMRINGTTKSLVANHLGESIAGAVTIRAFKQEDHFFAKSLDLIDNNASPSFHCFAATEWLTQRLEIMGAAILSLSALVITLLPAGTYSPGEMCETLFKGMQCFVTIS